MFTKGEITEHKVAAYYAIFLTVATIISLSFFNSLDDFIKSKMIEELSFTVAILGVFYIVCISKLKDILLVKMFNTERYDAIYKAAMSSQKVSEKNKNYFYTDKYGPLNHFVDMVRSCGWTMLLSYLLITVLNSYNDSSFFNTVALLSLIAGILSCVISSYYIYKNIAVLYRFINKKEA